MTPETAIRINTAVCNLWLFKNDIIPRIAHADILLVQCLTAGQIETATEVIEAINRDSMQQPVPKPFRCMLDPAAIPSLREYAYTFNL